MNDEMDLGPCCACGQTKPDVRNIVSLHKRYPPSELAYRRTSGWGCFQCGLPMEGANTVVCDECLETGVPIRFAVLGYLTAPEHLRIPLEQLTEPFDHDYFKHPETWQLTWWTQSLDQPRCSLSACKQTIEDDIPIRIWKPGRNVEAAFHSTCFNLLSSIRPDLLQAPVRIVDDLPF
ncbi:MAG: hypothetical protein H6636_06870 [Anaerolineales bacterium]|nr:hypothetical protein [Anaerolineales bacterium]